MKKVFVPTKEELIRMQGLGANVYKYLLVKAIESTIVYGLKNPKNGSILETSYKDMKSNFYIERAVCKLYPEEIIYSKGECYSVEACLDAIETKKHNCSLDNLAYFDNSTLGNGLVMEKAITMLEEELRNNPRYRFEYMDNTLLNKIFNGEIFDIDYESIAKSNREEVFKALCKIEPYYAYALNTEFNSSNFTMNLALNIAIDAYAKRYGISPNAYDYYEGADVFDEETEINYDGIKCYPGREAKKLIRSINRTNKTLTRK